MNTSFGPTFDELVNILTFRLFSYGGSSVTVLSLILTAAFAVMFFKFTRRANSWFVRRILTRWSLAKTARREALLIFRGLVSFAGALTILKLSGIDVFLYYQLVRVQTELSAVVDLKLFSLGKTPVTLWTTVYLLILSWLLVRVTGRAEEIFERRLVSRTKVDRGMIEGMGAGLRYSLVTVGMVVLFQSAGIDLSALTVLAGAAGIAIGLGLQSLMNNLVSGLVILFERPIKIGDRIDIGGTTGDVAHVSLRATTIQTGDGITIIVPNSEFITSKVVNWTYSGRRCAFKLQVNVPGPADPNMIKQLLLTVAQEHPGVLKSPPPTVLLEEFGNEALKFSLSIWTADYVTRPAALRSELNFAIAKIFGEHEIALPGLREPPSAIVATDPEQAFRPPQQTGAGSQRM
jgi:small-conductance mechanosensitive channel